MTVETALSIPSDEDQRAKLSSWVKIKVNQSKPPVSKAMRSFLKQLSNDICPEDIPEGRLLSALERETLIRAQKLHVVSDLDSLSPAKGSTGPSCSLFAEWTASERIPTHELAVMRNGAVSAKIDKEDGDGLANQLGFCMDMNGKEFPPVSGLWDDEKWEEVGLEEDEDGIDEDLKVSFMDDDDDWVLAVMLELEQCVQSEDLSQQLDFRRAVLEGPPRPLSQDSNRTDDTEVAEDADAASEEVAVEALPLGPDGNVLLRSELVLEDEPGRRDIGSWKKSRSVAEARRILQQTEKRVKQGKKGKGKNKNKK